MIRKFKSAAIAAIIVGTAGLAAYGSNTLSPTMHEVSALRARAESPELVSAEAVFETTTNDKDHDSYVSVTVKRGNTVIVGGGPFGGHWNDHSDHSMALNIGRGWTRDDLKNRVRTELSFSTNGNDKWEFNYILRMTWSDGTVTENRYNGQVLTQDDRFRSYAVSL